MGLSETICIILNILINEFLTVLGSKHVHTCCELATPAHDLRNVLDALLRSFKNSLSGNPTGLASISHHIFSVHWLSRPLLIQLKWQIDVVVFDWHWLSMWIWVQSVELHPMLVVTFSIFESLYQVKLLFRLHKACCLAPNALLAFVKLVMGSTCWVR